MIDVNDQTARRVTRPQPNGLPPKLLTRIVPKKNSFINLHCSKAVVVLGMHRSGTSAMAGILNILGVDLGQTLLSPDEYNEKGYWEHANINDTHERLLAALDSSWDDIYSLPENWWNKKEVKPFNLKIFNTLKKDFSNSTLWGIKDPRTCRLLPIWTRIFRKLNCNPCFIIISRHPYEVAKSLAKRDGFNKQKSYILWLEHMIEAEKWTRKYPRLFISYDHLLNDYQTVLKQIESGFSIVWPKKLSKVSVEIERFLSPALKHHKKPLEDFKNQSHIYSLAVSVYEAIKEVNFAKNEIEVLSKVRKEFEKIKELAKPFLQVGKAEIADRDAGIKQAYKNHTDEILRLNKERDRLSSWGQNLDEDIKQKDKQIIDLNKEVANLANWGQGLDRAIKQKDSVIAGLQDELKSLSKWGKTLDENIKLKEMEIRDFQNKIETFSASNKQQKKIIRSLNKSLKSKDIGSIQPSGLMEYDDIYDETVYLEANPDVVEAVIRGEFVSGYEHWLKHGLSEYKECLRGSGFIEHGSKYDEALYLKANPDNKIKLLKSKTIADITNVKRQTVTDSVALIVPAKNAGPEFESMLFKITRQELVKNLKIVVVNSGRKDGTAEIAKSFGATVVEILPQDFNHGETRNLGAQYATNSDYLVFMTQDSIPIGNYFLCDLINSFKLDPQVAAVTTRQVPNSNADLFACWSMWHHYNFLKLFKTEILFSPNISTLPYPQKRRISQLDDVCSAYKAEIFAKNKFKKLNFAEDLDYGYRIVKKGHKLLYNHDVAVIHSHNRDAVYVLKRSYVDTIVLPGVLEYQPGCSNVPNLNDLLTELNAFYNALKKAISKTKFSVDDPLSVFKNLLLKQIDKPAVSSPNLNPSLDNIFSKINSIYRLKDTNYPLKKTNVLLHSFLDCLKDFERFLNKRPLIELDTDVRSTLFKIFANIAGTSLGNYSYTNHEKQLDRILCTASV